MGHNGYMTGPVCNLPGIKGSQILLWTIHEQKHQLLRGQLEGRLSLFAIQTVSETQKKEKFSVLL